MMAGEPSIIVASRTFHHVWVAKLDEGPGLTKEGGVPLDGT